MADQEAPKFSLSEAMDLLTDKELDKTKKALEGLKKEVEKDNEKNIDEAMDRVKKAFAEDAEELDLSETDRDGYWEAIEVKLKNDMLQETPEFENLNNYINDIENLTGLRDVINDKDPIRKLKTIAKEMGILTGMAGALRNWADSMKAGKKNDTFLGNIVRKWADKLEEKDKEPETKTAKKPKAPAKKKEDKPAKPEAEKKAPELAERETKVLKGFEKAGLAVNKDQLKLDLDAMEKNDWKDIDDYIEGIQNPDNPIHKIAKSYEKVTGKTFEAQGMDLLFATYDPNRIPKLIDAIEGKANSEYIVDQTTQGIRQFLNDRHLDVANSTDDLEKYKRV